MPDLLVSLLKLPPSEPLLNELRSAAINLRRAQPFEITRVQEFVCQSFSRAWADEISIGFTHRPISVFIATYDSRVVGFAAYECTRRDFFGPTGVSKEMQGRGIGKALLLACLEGLRELGYVYAIIGRAGPVEFYEKTVGGIVIPDSEPGIYVDLLR